MKLAVLSIAAAVLLLPPARAEDDAGITTEAPTIRGTSIRWVRTKNVDVQFGGDVVSLGRKKTGDEPKGTHGNTLGGTTGDVTSKRDSGRVSTEDKSPKSAENSVSLGDKFPTGARVEGKDGKGPYEGIIQSRNDLSTGNVAVIDIPDQGTIQNPVKADGSPLTQLDLMRLGQGYVSQITLRGGQVLRSPQQPVSG